MKIPSRLLTLAALTAASLLHAEKPAAGPQGGRLLAAEPHAAEFFVTPERRIELTFLDDAGRPVPPDAQVAAITAEPASGKVGLALTRTARGFITTEPLPAGEPYRVVVQLRATPDAKPRNFRLDLNLGLCGECQHAEYACTCTGH